MRGFVRGEGESSGMPGARKYPVELIERGVRLTLESGCPIAHVARDLGVESETLRRAVRQAEADSGTRGDLLSSQEREEIKKLRRENFELRRANEILKSAGVFFAKELDPRPDEVSRYVDEHRGRFGVEPICRILGVRRPPTTSERPAGARRAASRTSGCWRGSGRCTRRTTAPMATGGRGRRCGVPASRSRAAGCSG
jgi:transposase